AEAAVALRQDRLEEEAEQVRPLAEADRTQPMRLSAPDRAGRSRLRPEISGDSPVAARSRRLFAPGRTPVHSSGNVNGG
ncbi:hypothetical protein, partial [Streptosporangium sp. NPDC001681]|uniref:hypothetical protein n=1 Tax=Streptosporangium sp. NPDC001681 TaxID=3154395 RepID=UPI00332AC521